MTFTATYDPADNKLRLRSATRLPSDLYARAKSHGFSWAPRQELFVAPMWTPCREDFLTDLCGEIGDEDTSLVDRAAERAERFDDYSEKRQADAERAHSAVAAIADGIPLGQPILVGHHSQRHAERDAEKIENGMRRAVKLWQTSEYWTRRAAGALAHAKYKELPGVRYRRIKGIEADKRKQERNRDEAAALLKAWSRPELTKEQATAIAGAGYSDLTMPRKEGDDQTFTGRCSAYDAMTNGHPKLFAPRTMEEVVAAALEAYPRRIAYAERWIAHYENRLAYERAMLNEGGGLKADQFNVGVGGRILRRGEWLVVRKVNMRDGRVQSYSVFGHWAGTVTPDEVRDYKPPQPGDEAKARKAGRIAPLCNYPGEGFMHQTKAEYDRTVPGWSDFSKTRHVKATDKHDAHRVRCNRKPGGQYYDWTFVFITDAKRTDPPAADAAETKTDLKKQPETPPAVAAAERAATYEELDAKRAAAGATSVNATTGELSFDQQPPTVAPGDKFKQLQAVLDNGGVKAVSAPQLFPTPNDLASRLVALADVQPGQRILEPSAGTGQLVRAVFNRCTGADCCKIVTVEVNGELCSMLRTMRDKWVGANDANFVVRQRDFLELTVSDLGQFHRIVMNPPFGGGADIKHVLHARQFLKHGGTLAAIVANGPRQQEQLQPLCRDWINLPAGSFSEVGTNVNTAVAILDAP